MLLTLRCPVDSVTDDGNPLELDVIKRIYPPDQEKMKTWKAPKA